MDADTALYLNARSGDANAVERLRARLNQTPAPANAYEGWSFLCSFEDHGAQFYMISTRQRISMVAAFGCVFFQFQIKIATFLLPESKI